jgi:hypothetical protein
MKILNRMSLADQHVTIKRAEDCWQLFSACGTLVAEASNTSKLGRYAMEMQGATTCKTLPWPGYHWRLDV